MLLAMILIGFPCLKTITPNLIHFPIQGKSTQITQTYISYNNQFGYITNTSKLQQIAPHGPILLKLEYDTSNGKKYNNTTTESQNNDHHHHQKHPSTKLHMLYPYSSPC
jgi:hypothetical protein